jgi:hypothetical protein
MSFKPSKELIVRGESDEREVDRESAKPQLVIAKPAPPDACTWKVEWRMHGYIYWDF